MNMCVLFVLSGDCPIVLEVHYWYIGTFFLYSDYFEQCLLNGVSMALIIVLLVILETWTIGLIVRKNIFVTLSVIFLFFYPVPTSVWFNRKDNIFLSDIQFFQTCMYIVCFFIQWLVSINLVQVFSHLTTFLYECLSPHVCPIEKSPISRTEIYDPLSRPQAPLIETWSILKRKSNKIA